MFKAPYIWYMGLIARIDWPEGHRIALWHCTETVDALARLLPGRTDEVAEKSKLRHPKRALEWHCSRAALRLGLDCHETVNYLQNGKPYLSAQALSLSHCLPIAGALVHASLGGMDIQAPDPKLALIRQKFTHEDEWTWMEGRKDELDCITLLWSAKEALFKVYGEQLVFAEQIRIDAFEPGQSELSARVYRSEHGWISHSLRCFSVLNHWIVAVVR